MIVLHGTLHKDEFLLWGEIESLSHADRSRWETGLSGLEPDKVNGQQPEKQPSAGLSVAREVVEEHAPPPRFLGHAASYSQVKDALDAAGIPLVITRRQHAQADAWLPSLEDRAMASSPMLGPAADNLDADSARRLVLQPWVIPACRLMRDQIVELLCYCIDREQLCDGVLVGHDLQFWAQVLRFAGALVGKQQFLPGIRITNQGAAACWEPVFLGEAGDQLARLSEAMPGVCLAYQSDNPDDNRTAGGAQDLLVKFIQKIVDCLVRKSIESIHLPLPVLPAGDGQAEQGKMHGRWLAALLGQSSDLTGSRQELAQLADQIAEWRRPVEIASDTPFRLCFRLEEPVIVATDDRYDTAGSAATGLEFDPSCNLDEDHRPNSNSTVDLPAPRSTGPDGQDKPQIESSRWYLRFMLLCLADPSLVLPVETVLSPAFQELSLLRGGRVSAREYLFRSLGQAVRLCPEIAESFHQQVPSGIQLSTHAAHDFLAHKAPVLKNAGFSIQLPPWWTNKRPRVSAGINISQMSDRLFGLNELTKFSWHLALGPVPLAIEELEMLAQLKLPLIYMNGAWVELNPEQLDPILIFFRKKASGEARGQELVRMALGDVKLPAGVTFQGLSGQGPIVDLVNKLKGQVDFEQVEPHDSFAGSLRPYQVRGLSWLEFLRKVGLGACLADDMGLGKTVQTLAFIQRNRHETCPEKRRPSLLVCPTSVLSNWQKEAEKFTPDLKIQLHHGLDRNRGAELRKAAKESAVVLTTYALLHRDKDDLRAIDWETIILDEAQNIKNPEAHQAKAAMSLKANFRIALTGTPVENSVGDLWSLMHFLNPGFLGSQHGFRERFFIPIQARQDEEALQQLKQLTAPFILRRLKTDKSIAPDLPEKLERKTRCYLTKEQATLYAAVVEEATGCLESASGMKRKSIVLITLLRLKQICNHPALFLTDKSRIPGRSGKLKRLVEMLMEVLARGERALVFTQFAQMGSIIQSHIQSTLGKEVLFLHGGVERTARTRMVDRFQSQEDGPPVFVLSLKAGGSGLNLTRANHVFHFDRWWNPAVEEQATDRAFRIGQVNDVQVHKYVCSGTLEDSIDEIIERKKIIASNTVGSGEGWLTELSTKELKDLFALRSTALID